MDKAEMIVEKIAEICRDLPGDFFVEIDRRLDIDGEEAGDLPLIVISSGEQETAPPQGSNPAVWARRWKISPIISIYFECPLERQRAEMSRIWLEFLARLKSSKIELLGSQGSLPGVKMTPVHRPELLQVCEIMIELEMTFDR